MAEFVVRSGDREERVEARETPAGLCVRVGDHSYVVDRSGGAGSWSLLVEGQQREVSVRERNGRTGGFAQRAEYTVQLGADQVEVVLLEPLAYLAEQTVEGTGGHGASVVRANMPGRVVAVLVAEGDVVARGQGVLVLEAMKMENEIPAESGGVIRRVFVAAGQAVEGGDQLFEVGEPEPE